VLRWRSSIHGRRILLFRRFVSHESLEDRLKMCEKCEGPGGLWWGECAECGVKIASDPHFPKNFTRKYFCNKCKTKYEYRDSGFELIIPLVESA